MVICLNQCPTTTEGISIRRRRKLTRELLNNPDRRVRYFMSLEDEVMGDACLLNFGTFRLGKVWEVWVYDQRPWDFDGMGLLAYDPLFREACFSSRDLSMAHIFKHVEVLQQAVNDDLSEQKDQAWEIRKSNVSDFAAPYWFVDDLEYRHGVTLETEKAVFEFYLSNPGLRYLDEYGDSYHCKLVDRNGDPCWVVESHRGEMILE